MREKTSCHFARYGIVLLLLCGVRLSREAEGLLDRAQKYGMAGCRESGGSFADGEGKCRERRAGRYGIGRRRERRI